MRPATGYLTRLTLTAALACAAAAPERVAAQDTTQSAASQVAEGRRLIGAGRLPEALEVYRGAVRADSTLATAWSGLAATLHRLERYPEALAAIDRAASIDPRSAGIRFNRALTYSELGRVEAAAAELDSVVAIRPDFAPGWTERGAARALIGRIPEAQQDWARSLAVDPNYIWARFYRGIAAIAMGDYPNAAADLDSVVQKQSLLGAQLWRWVAYRLAGRPAPAIATTDQAWPAPVAAFLRGDVSEAQLIAAARQQALEIDDRRLAVAYFYIAQHHLAEGRTDLARQALERTLAQRAPRHAEVVVAAAQLRRLAGRR